MKKILVIGAAGLLGQKIFEYGRKQFDVLLGDINYFEFLPKEKYFNIDITDPTITNKKISELNPEWVILTAAMTNVDQCEINKELSYKVNVISPKNVATAAKKIGSQLIYISTDFVFDGKKKLYNENDQPNPLSNYGKTKLNGELEVKRIDIDNLIVRTSVLFGWNLDPNNFNYVAWIYNKLKSNENIQITNSQWNTPTLADNLAQAILMAINKKLMGLYHMCGSECINRYDFALKVAKHFNLDDTLVKPIPEFKQKAERPKFSCLDNSKASKDLNFQFYNIDEALIFMKKQKDELLK